MRIRWVFVAIALFGPISLGQELPASIPVVKTWEDLQKRKPIEIGGGVRIRLGLEADKIPKWSGAFLYCLTEGYTPASSGRGEPPFGPVHADVQFEDEKHIKEVMRWSRNSKELPKGSYLYVRAVAVDRIGSYKILVTHRDGKVLAEAKYEGTKDFFHPWTPWIEGREPKAPREGIVLPVVDNLEIAFVETGKSKTGALPAFLPIDKLGLTIKMENDEIVICGKSEFTTSRPDYHFLARWWVNDKPYVPKQSETLWGFDGYGLVRQGKELRLPFQFQSERLGAKPGDKIGMQLMHSAGEWAWCSPTLQKIGSSRQKDSDPIRISNRIDFVVPNKE